MNVVTLSNNDRDSILSHFLGLGPDSRNTRFFGTVSDQFIQNYVSRLDFNQNDFGFGIFDDDLNLIGFTHVYVTEKSDKSLTAEVGFSVSDDSRGRGYGSLMFTRLKNWCKAQSIDTIYVECLATNYAMKELAKKNGASIITDGDLIGQIDMSADCLERLVAIRETFKHDQLALVDLTAKKQVKALRDALFRPFDLMTEAMVAYNQVLSDLEQKGN